MSDINKHLTAKQAIVNDLTKQEVSKAFKFFVKQSASTKYVRKYTLVYLTIGKLVRERFNICKILTK